MPEKNPSNLLVKTVISKYGNRRTCSPRHRRYIPHFKTVEFNIQEFS